MKKIETENFCNEGFGWICRRCRASASKNEAAGGEKARLLTEGEAESKNPVLSNRALAKWADAEQTTLICPNCRTVEKIETQN